MFSQCILLSVVTRVQKRRVCNKLMDFSKSNWGHYGKDWATKLGSPKEEKDLCDGVTCKDLYVCILFRDVY